MSKHTRPAILPGSAHDARSEPARPVGRDTHQRRVGVELGDAARDRSPAGGGQLGGDRARPAPERTSPHVESLGAPVHAGSQLSWKVAMAGDDHTLPSGRHEHRSLPFALDSAEQVEELLREILVCSN